MADKKLRFEVEADTKKAEKDLERIEEAVEELEKATPEVEITADTTELERATEDAADALKKLTTDTPKVTLEVDDTALRGAADRSRAAIDGIGKSADSSKSVLANMVGNATQDLGALSGVAGSAGVAIGQMGEYMADAAAAGEGIGSIAGNFLRVAGPVAAISLGVGLLTTVFSNMSKSAEEARKRAEDFAKAMEAAGGSVAGTFANLADAGQFDALADDLDRLGLTFKDFVQLAQGGALEIDPVRQDALARLREVEKLYRTTGAQKYASDIKAIAKEMGLSEKDALAMAHALETVGSAAETSGQDAQRALDLYAQQRRVFQDNADTIDVYNEAVKRGIDTTGLSAEALTRLMGQQDLAAQQQVDLAAAIATGNEAMAESARVTREEAIAANQELISSIDELNAKLGEMAGAVLSEAETRVALADAQTAYAESVKEGKNSTDELIVGAQGVAEKFADVLEAQKLANGESFTTTDRNAAIKKSLEETAKTASGPVAAGIQSVVDKLDAIPPEVNTDMTVNNATALAKLNEQIRLMQIIRDTSAETLAAYRSIPGGAGGAILGQAAPLTQNITVNAGFGTDAFAVQSAVINSARQAARLARGARRNG
jgi:hypothetical protein